MKNGEGLGTLITQEKKIIKNGQHRTLGHKLDVFGSVLACAKSDHVFQKLSLETLSLSFITITLPQTVCFIVFSGSPTAVHHAFLFFNTKACPQSKTDVFTCTMVLHCGHTFLRRIDLIYSIALWAHHSGLLVKDSHKRLLKFDGKIPQYCVLQVT